jgi:hypothetical protein
MILAGADLDIMYLPPSLFTEGKILSPKQQHQREGLLTIEQCIEQTMTPSNASYLLDLVRRHRRLTKKNKFMFTWQDSGFIFFMLVLIIVYGRYRQVRGIAPIHNSRNEL